MFDFEAMVSTAKQNKASDIHISSQNPVYLRIDGQLKPFGESVPVEEINRLLAMFLNSAQLDKFQRSHQIDFLYQTGTGDRLRGNAFKTQLGPAMCLRRVEPIIKPYSELGFPEFMQKKLLTIKHGLVLIVGPTGQGKSTTLASILKERATKLSEHIVTLEDPIEFIIPSEVGLTQQREIGRDVETYEAGIRGAMREDPNIIMVGELRDPDTMASSLVLAETGHLVFATLHTNSAQHTISRVLDSMPADQVPQVRSQLAQNLKMVVSQRLLPAKEGNGRVLAYEIMNMNIGIANHIREDKIHQIYNAIQTDQSGEMIQFEQSLASLVLNNYISLETAANYAMDKNQLKAILEFNNYDFTAEQATAPPAG